ncbi:MAG: hypothetical protein LBU89_10210 [Fibromonadaceae bacterium]|jgi:hypothetical protein|nr:hypothetical protein [Fibromonadaceae bacterium]
MIKKFFSFVVFFVFLSCFFSACSNPKPDKTPLNLVSLGDNWTQVTEGRPFRWDDVDGFFPNREQHPYGFDRHTVPGSNSLDSIVYASVLDGDYGYAALKINYAPEGSPEVSYGYFICDPTKESLDTIAIIDNSSDKQTYKFTASIVENGSVKKVALCRISEVGTQIAQELHIYPYKLKDDYSFYVYILGDEKDPSDRHQFMRSEEFWSIFDQTFSQAVVKRDSLFGRYRTVDRGYIMTRAHGTYDGNCVNHSVINGAVSYLRSNAEKGPRRNFIQVGYPTKRFWPLISDGGGYIQICGTPYKDEENPSFNQDPTINPARFSLELETLPGTKCSVNQNTSVTWDARRRLWYKNNNPDDIVTVRNTDPNCVVFADNHLGDYVGEVGTSAAIAMSRKNLSVTFRLWPLTLVFSLYPSSVVIQPWLEELTAKTALHELGHTMGLADILRVSPSYNGIGNSEENNLMVQGSSLKSLHLRKRAIETIRGNLEYQWDCLHNVNGTCERPGRDPYNR